jgi:hypothetical protein
MKAFDRWVQRGTPREIAISAGACGRTVAGVREVKLDLRSKDPNFARRVLRISMTPNEALRLARELFWCAKGTVDPGISTPQAENGKDTIRGGSEDG